MVWICGFRCCSLEAPLCSVDAAWLVVLMMSTEKSKKKQEHRVHNYNQCITVQILTFSTNINNIFWVIKFNSLHKSSQFTFDYVALYTIQILSKQLYSEKQENSLSITQEDNNKESFFS